MTRHNDRIAHQQLSEAHQRHTKPLPVPRRRSPVLDAVVALAVLALQAALWRFLTHYL